MKDAYCSFEIAKLLKEKGFCERCFMCYEQDGKVFEGFGNWNKVDIYIAAPTHQMACAWLREIHNIDIEIRRSPNTMMYKCLVYKDTLVKCITDAIMEIYEDAVEAALKYALEDLI